MQKVMVALLKDVRQRDGIMRVLNEAEAGGYAVHLFELGTDEVLVPEQFDTVLNYLRRDYQVDRAVSLFSNDGAFVLRLFARQSPFIDDYYLFAEEKQGCPDFQACVDRSLEVARPITVFYSTMESIMPLLMNFLPYFHLRQGEHFQAGAPVLNQLLHPERTKAWKRTSSYLSKIYSLPSDLLNLFLLQYYGNRGMIDQEFALLGPAGRSIVLAPPSVKNKMTAFLDRLLGLFNTHAKIAIWSLLFYITKDKKYITSMMDEHVMKDLRFNEKYSLYLCLKRIAFVGGVPLSFEEGIRMRQIYNTCVDEFAAMLQLPDPIPAGRRDRSHVVIFTSQFLSMGHAPTRNVVDYARNLKKMGKDVLIINSGDILNRLYVPFLNGFIGHKNDQLDHADSIIEGGDRFAYYQSAEDMPNIPAAQEMIDRVRAFNPEFILSMGESAVGDLCSRFTTVISIIFGGGMPSYRHTYWGVTRRPVAGDQKIMDHFHVGKERIFPIHFTFLRKQKQKPLSRKELGIPEQAAVMCVVGNRLDNEVTDTYLEELNTIAGAIKNACILFIGGFNNYEQAVKKYPLLRQQAKNLGRVDDIQSIYAICDFYLNPPRSGGASSAAEALDEGVPVITRPYGDVYSQLWMNQAFQNTAEVVAYLRRCLDDPSYYKQQSECSKKFSESLFDSEQMMATLVNQADQIVYGASADE